MGAKSGLSPIFQVKVEQNTNGLTKFTIIQTRAYKVPSTVDQKYK
jgi:hypothetical protein